EHVFRQRIARLRQQLELSCLELRARQGCHSCLRCNVDQGDATVARDESQQALRPVEVQGCPPPHPVEVKSCFLVCGQGVELGPGAGDHVKAVDDAIAADPHQYG